MRFLLICCVFCFFVPSVVSLAVATSVDVSWNKSYFKATYNHTCDGTQQCMMNIEIETNIPVTKILVYIKVNIPDNDNDKDYKRELIRAVVDLEKIFKGVHANPVVRAFANDYFRSMDFEPKFPFPAGMYRFKNWTVYDQFIPVITTTKVYTEVRIVGKVAGNKKSQFFALIKVSAEIRR